jgi:hypothetical protein
VRFRRRKRAGRIDPAADQLAQWDADTQADAGDWLRSLRDTGSDGTDDPPGVGVVAMSHGLMHMDGRCREYSRGMPGLMHVAGCHCLMAVETAEDGRGR